MYSLLVILKKSFVIRSTSVGMNLLPFPATIRGREPLLLAINFWWNCIWRIRTLYLSGLLYNEVFNSNIGVYGDYHLLDTLPKAVFSGGGLMLIHNLKFKLLSMYSCFKTRFKSCFYDVPPTLTGPL